MKKFLTNKIVIASTIFGILYLIGWYLLLPRLSLHSFGFLFYLSLLITYVMFFVLRMNREKQIEKYKDKKCRKLRYDNNTLFKVIKVSAQEKFNNVYYSVRSIILVIGSVLIFGFLNFVIGSKLFRATDYYSQLEIKEESISEFEEIYEFGNEEVMLPIIDKELAFKLAEAKLADYGAQFEISFDNFTLISVERNGKPELIRVAPLEYGSLFVSLSKMTQGTIGYVEVNVVTKEAKLVKFEDGLKYMPTAKFGYDLERHIYSKYPSAMYDETNFEIDDKGNPYWVIPTYKPEIGLYGGKKNNSVILCNAITGELNRYELGKEPSWVDRVYDETIIEAQATNALRYKHGFMNVHFGAKNEVLQVSDGYNYFLRGGHTYYVSCITSPSESDQTSVGFLCVDLKTGHATKYLIPGITEMRAREIAMQDERVKAQSLTATWPILINYNGTPTYFVVLKNSVQAQKIVFINVSDGSLVAMGNNINEAMLEYNKLLASNGNDTTLDEVITGKVTRIRDTGTTIEFTVENQEGYFVVNVDLSLDARFLAVGDTVKMTVKKFDGYKFVTSIEKLN